MDSTLETPNNLATEPSNTTPEPLRNDRWRVTQFVRQRYVAEW